MQDEAPSLPTRLTWEPGYDTGHAAIDAQHRGLLDACNELAGLCAGDEADARFDTAFARLKALLRSHFETEAALLAAGDPVDLDDVQAECEEFEYLADEIATVEHFDRLELQRFLALWCQGHVTASARQLRAV